MMSSNRIEIVKAMIREDFSFSDISEQVGISYKDVELIFNIQYLDNNSHRTPSQQKFMTTKFKYFRDEDAILDSMYPKYEPQELTGWELETFIHLKK